MTALNWNKVFYRTGRFVRHYQSIASKGLTAPELYCLSLVPETHRGVVLDIGIGAGRTTGPLSETFKEYIGIDYAEPMIAAARALYPGLDLRVADARDLQFKEMLDCVMFSFNGIDSVSYDDRLAILSEVARVLSPGGYFIYSTHNLGYTKARTYRTRFLARELFGSARAMILGLPNRLKNFSAQWIDEERGVALINDSAHTFTLVTMYVDLLKEMETLKRFGLSSIAAIGCEKGSHGYDERDQWVYICARKD